MNDKSKIMESRTYKRYKTPAGVIASIKVWKDNDTNRKLATEKLSKAIEEIKFCFSIKNMIVKL